MSVRQSMDETVRIGEVVSYDENTGLASVRLYNENGVLSQEILTDVKIIGNVGAGDSSVLLEELEKSVNELAGVVG